MARYAAFLRGMNLGNRRLKNDELRSVFEKLDFDDVATFRASGNVIFDAPTAKTKKAQGELTARIEAALADSLGYEVPVFLRSDAEVQAIAAAKPFKAKLVAASKGKLQVAFLLEKPVAAKAKKVLSLGTGEDRLAVIARELYWLPSGGLSDSELDLSAIGAALGLTTMRTMGTVEQIAAKHCS